MKVSIITVCYNAADTIEKTIKSVVSQTYKDIEYIVIDGLSSDTTTSVINKYTFKISYFISEKDFGIYNAMNKGIKKTTGDILYFLNANDTLYDENVINDVVDYFKKAKAQIVIGNMSFLDPNGNVKELRDYSTSDKLFLTSENLCHQGIFYKKEVFEKCGLYQEKYRLLADYDFNLRAIVQKKLKASHINRFIANFTLEGISNNDKTKKMQKNEFLKIRNKYFKPRHFVMNKILNKTFRNIARNSKLRKIAGKLLGFSL